MVDQPLVPGSRNHALYCAYTIRLLCQLLPAIRPNTVFDYSIMINMVTRALVRLNDDVCTLLERGS